MGRRVPCQDFGTLIASLVCSFLERIRWLCPKELFHPAYEVLEEERISVLCTEYVSTDNELYESHPRRRKSL